MNWRRVKDYERLCNKMNSEQNTSSEYLVAALCEKWVNLGAITGMKRGRLRTHWAAETSNHTVCLMHFSKQLLSSGLLWENSDLFSILRKSLNPPYLKWNELVWRGGLIHYQRLKQHTLSIKCILQLRHLILQNGIFLGCATFQKR